VLVWARILCTIWNDESRVWRKVYGKDSLVVLLAFKGWPPIAGGRSTQGKSNDSKKGETTAHVQEITGRAAS